MKFYMISIAYLAADIINSAIAAPIARRDYLVFTNGDYTGLTVGAPLVITRSGNSGAVTVTVNLKSSSADNLQTIGTVACKLPFLFSFPSLKLVVIFLFPFSLLL